MARRRLTLLQGDLLSIAGIALALLLLWPVRSDLDLLPATALLVAAWVCFWIFPHCLTHRVVGRLLGFRFLYYFIGRSAIRKLNMPGAKTIGSKLPLLGIKVDPTTLTHASPTRRTLMFSSGAVASMLLPFIPTTYGVAQGQGQPALLLGVLSVANLVFTLYYSPKAGDLGKARRVALAKP